MYFVSKGVEKVSVTDLESAKALLYSLSDYDCSDSFKKQYVAGIEKAGTFKVLFDEREIITVSLEDAERVQHWMLTLGCQNVTIERIGE